MNIALSESASARFSNFYFLMAVAVVFMHSGCDEPIGSAGWWLSELTTQGAFRMAVPFFFFASGFFLAGRVQNDGWWKDEVFKRVRTILVPFWIWNGLFFLIFVTKIIFGNVMAGRTMNTAIPGLFSVLLVLTGLNPTWPANGPLWFLRSLFVFVVLSPILLRFSRRWLGLLLLFVLYVCFDWQENWRTPVTTIGVGVFSWEGLFYFALGLRVRGMRGLNVSPNLSMLFGVVGVFLIVLRAVFHGQEVMSALPFKIVIVPCILLALVPFLPVRRFPPSVLALTFPIYCLHSLFLFVLRFSGIQWTGISGHLLLWAFTCIGSAVVTNWLRRCAPVFSSYAFGGR